MNRKGLIIFFVLLLLVTLSDSAKSQAERRLTLMIYMCGSDLESNYGAATNDVWEMLSCIPDTREVTVLLMTGGSRTWQLFGTDATMIHEMSSRGMRTVWRAEDHTGGRTMNMGDPGTLGMLLKYGSKQYPADEYALIIWNHGGGSMGGVCFDELYGMDSLTIGEMKQAFRSTVGLKLSWIGFDACLMDTLEVASALEPYAEYMIASQETEPATGWDYAFLNGLENDHDGAETGRRIIDAYFEKTEDNGADMLTLSCIRLSSIPNLIAETDALFGSIAEEMNESYFQKLARIRHSAMSMAKIGTESGSEWYDLIDLGDLVSFFRTEGMDTGGVESALGRTVVYQRSNNERVHGISVYHPFWNKKQYTEAWHNDYLTMKSGHGYASYIFRFGSFLTEDSETDWGGLQTQYVGKDSGGDEVFRCALTKSQVSDCLSARLIILMPHDPGSDAYTQIASIPASIDENGNVTAVYNGKSLYAVDDGGHLLGPLFYRTINNDTVNVVPLVLQPRDEAMINGMTNAFMVLENDQNGANPDILAYYMHDSVTDSYTNRIPYRPELYSVRYFQYQYRSLPMIHDNGTYPGFESWERGSIFNWIGRDPNENLRMQYFYDQLSGRQLLAVFEITDNRQNQYCARPAEIPNQTVQSIEEKIIIDNEQFSFSVSGQVVNAEQKQGVTFVFHCKNNTDREMTFELDNLILNGSRLLGYGDQKNLKASESARFQKTVSPEKLLYLSDITLLTGELTVKSKSGDDVLYEGRIRAEFAISVSEIAPDWQPEASVTHNGITWNLMDYDRQREGDLEFTFLVQNMSGQDCSPDDYQILLNGIESFTMCNAYQSIPSGSEMLVTYEFRNDIMPISSVSVKDITVMSRKIVISDQVLRRNGYDAVNEIRLVCYPNKWEHITGDVVTLPLQQPVVVPEFVPTNQNNRWYSAMPEHSEADNAMLIRTDDYTMELGNVLLADDGIVFSLYITNYTDDFVDITLGSYSLNGRRLSGDETYHVAPRGKKAAILGITKWKLENAAAAWDEISSFSFTAEYTYSRGNPEITLLFPAASRLGEPGGRILTGSQFTVQKEEPATEEARPDFEYTVGEDGTITITAYTGLDKALTIPSAIDGKAVTAIGESAFKYCDSLVSVTIPEGVIEIGYMAFWGCDNLESIDIPRSVVSIRECAFSHCSSLAAVTIPDGVTAIRRSTFLYCQNLTSVRIPETVVSIGDEAFSDCAVLETIAIPNSVSKIGANPFTGCDSLKEISISPDHPVFSVVDGVLFDHVNHRLISCPSSFAKEQYAIPDGTLAIGPYAFSHCHMTGITIPDSVTAIEECAFYFCGKLRELVIPDSVTAIGSDAFCGCGSLERMRIPDSVTEFGEGVFHYCGSLVSVSIPNGITFISASPFLWCPKLLEIMVSPDHPRLSIVDGALVDRTEQRLICCPAGLPVTRFTVPAGIRIIGKEAFSCCAGLNEIRIPDSITTIKEGAFGNCTGLTELTIPDSVTSIGEGAFGQSGLVSMVLPDSITVVEAYLFQSCPALTSVTIPDSVTTIREGAFSWCKALTTVIIPDSVTDIAPDAFDGCDLLSR